jgi:outer membrane protein OmpA-like peptidoglycan-associated protein
MNRSRFAEIALILGSSLATLLLLSGAATAQTVKVEGLINGRSGDTMTLQTSDSPKLVVELTDDTQVAQVQGVFKARRKEMSMAALTPGLKVKVEGTFDSQNRLVATKVTFKGNDLEQAEAIQAGVQPAKSQIQQTQQELEQQKVALQQQQQAMQQQQQEMAKAQTETAANKAAIEEANKRFGQLDDYNILDEVNVYFGNGKVALDPQYKPQLLQLAEKAKGINGYMIQVKGYASSVGSVALNQQLSEDRADSVTEFLQQQGHVALTRMLRVLRNNGIAGT